MLFSGVETDSKMCGTDERLF